MPLLRVIMNGVEVDRRDLGQPLVIGRDAACDLKIPHPDTSRRHCRIEPGSEGWIVIDLGSKNGTLIEGKPVTRRRLSDGDVLRVGVATLQFELAPRPRTLDDDVLDMLNRPGPEAATDDDAEVEQWAQEFRDSESGSQFVATPAPLAPTPPETAEPIPHPRGSRNLWEKANAAPRVISAHPSKSEKEPRAAGRPASAWYRRRIPAPAAVGAAVAAMVIGYFVFLSEPSGGGTPPPRHPTPPHKHSRLDD